MSLEEIEQEFVNSNKDIAELEEEIEDEVEDLLEEKSRSEILDDAEDLDEEFQEHVKAVLDYHILNNYEDLLDESELAEQDLEEALENIQRTYSREEILSAISESDEAFAEKVRDILG